MEAQSAAESVKKKERGESDENTLFLFVTTNPRRVLSVSLSGVKTDIYPSQIRTELKANLLWELFLEMF